MRYRKKPVPVEATPIEFILAVHKEHPEVLPEWILEAIGSQKLSVYEEVVVAKTAEGNMTGGTEDWLIQGVRGEIYPIKGSIFLETYERAEDVI